MGLTSSATSVALGVSWWSSSSLFGPSSVPIVVIPVTLPPGLFRLATSPSRTGSAPIRNTIGIVAVACLAASAAGAPPVVKIAVTWRRARSRASSGNRSLWSSPQRNSKATFLPSRKPASRKPSRKDVTRCASLSGDPTARKPITGPAGCCARAASGHAAAAPPSSVMNSRRLVCRESSIVKSDGGQFMTPPPSRLEARRRLGS